MWVYPMTKTTTESMQQPPSAPYEPPTLGESAPLEQVTLFSGAVNPDAGVIEFGNG